MDGDRTVNKLRIALVSYDRKELRVQKQYLQEQDSMVVCTCYQSGGKLLEELQQGVRYEIVVLCSQMVGYEQPGICDPAAQAGTQTAADAV